MSGTDWTKTPNLGLFKPVYDMDAEGWGGHLNQNADTLDLALGTSGAGALFLPLAGGTVSGTVHLNAPNVPFTSNSNTSGVQPQASGGNFTMTCNFANWFEVDFWNLITGGTTASFVWYQATGATTQTQLMTLNTGGLNVATGSLTVSGGAGFHGTTAGAAKPAVTGSRGGNAALASLMTALVAYGLVTDSTTA